MMRRLKIRKDLAAQELGIPVAWEKEDWSKGVFHTPTLSIYRVETSWEYGSLELLDQEGDTEFDTPVLVDDPAQGLSLRRGRMNSIDLEDYKGGAS